MYYYVQIVICAMYLPVYEQIEDEHLISWP